MKTRKQEQQSGFTLIEVIAVLVILAVLAAVAIPRYISLIDDARTQALEGAVAAGMSHVSLSYGRLALQNGQEPTAAEIATDAAANPPQSADYAITFAASATPGVNVTAAERDDATMTVTHEWLMP
jgi:MSHA pilin protein MshA